MNLHSNEYIRRSLDVKICPKCAQTVRGIRASQWAFVAIGALIIGVALCSWAKKIRRSNVAVVQCLAELGDWCVPWLIAAIILGCYLPRFTTT